VSGQHVEKLAISVGDFSGWSDCVSQICEPSIDHCAQLLLEHFVNDRGEQAASGLPEAARIQGFLMVNQSR
jgi:hypothetical protein